MEVEMEVEVEVEVEGWWMRFVFLGESSLGGLFFFDLFDEDGMERKVMDSVEERRGYGVALWEGDVGSFDAIIC